MKQLSLFNPERETHNPGHGNPVECLGMTFASDEERREYFLERLRAGLEELQEKLGGVPFTGVEDTITRLKSFQHWPFGDEERIRELAGRIADAARAARGKEPASRDLLGLYKDEVGFPHGKMEDILALSDPPYYTACPNPFIEDFIKFYGKPYDPDSDSYRREPFAADVSEGKNDPIYNAHSYHTKVPHRAIMRYILHYTEPGDIVFDGFCGTGMTGVAAQLCGDRATVESLGYMVDENGIVYQQETQEGTDGKARTFWRPFSKLGARRAVLNDLSPAATFIAYNYNTPVDVEVFAREARRILREVEDECGWMYATLVTGSEWRAADSELAVAGPGLQVAGLELPASGSGAGVAGPAEAEANRLAEMIRHAGSAADVRKLIHRLRTDGSKPGTHSPILGTINYTVWSDVFVCPECAREVVFWEAAVDKDAGRVHDEFPCPHCTARLTKRRMERAWVTRFDKAIGETVRQAKQVPVLINYSVGKKRYEKKPDAFDLALIEKIEEFDIPYWFPTDRMPEGDESRRNDDIGITHVHHFYTKRNLWVLGALYASAEHSSLKDLCKFFIQYACLGFCKLSRYVPTHFSQVNQYLSGTLYIGSQQVEVSPEYILSGKLVRMINRELRRNTLSQVLHSISDASINGLPSSCIDYIFTDPPFGGNLMYSELNFLWEAWLKVFTNNRPEAIENETQGKGPSEYQQLMTRCFQEYYRVLKPGRWMTVEFHNSKNRVWNAIQEALQAAGFVVADVRTLDKQQGTFKQVTSAGAVKQDIIISCYKPNGGLEQRFKLTAGTEEGVWDFVRSHLKQLPVFVAREGKAEVIAERLNYMLFDRMVSFHVRHGVTVPLSAAEFYHGLVQRFPERDGMYFLPDQAAEYDRKRMTVREVLQLQLYVTDEASAIQWLKQQLTRKPQTFQELFPQFLREIGGWQKHEKPLELKELLEQNFLVYNEKGPIPPQLVSWMKQSEKLRGIIQAELAAGRAVEDNGRLETGNPELLRAVRDRWYVPDPHKAGDLEKLRERALLREFEEYRKSSQRRLKVFRLEAVRAGFKKAWQDKDYATIIAVARKIPENVLQEDPKLLMWYDQALTRMGEDG
ncbi:MAG: DNA methylase [Thermoanaerobacteraceae bacterium]|nr:DNA methylase [Thermoanaerobacteraceae bacterium]